MMCCVVAVQPDNEPTPEGAADEPAEELGGIRRAVAEFRPEFLCPNCGIYVDDASLGVCPRCGGMLPASE